MNTTADPEPEINPARAHKTSGITATWHVKVVTGKEAQALLEMQNQAIIRLLTWAASQESRTSNNTADGRETRRNDSRETLELAA
jgi:hypothetical protein